MKSVKKIRIVFLTGNLCNGGAQRVIALLSSKLADKGLEVFLLVFYKSENEYSISKNVNISYMAEDYESYSNISPFKRIYKIRRYLKRISPDVGIGFMEAGYALYLSGIGLKIHCIASARIDPIHILNKTGFRAVINKWWFKKADAVVLQTESQKRNVLHLWKSCVIIPNPITDIVLEKDIDSYSEKCCNMIMVGRLMPQKDYETAIKAFEIVYRQHKDARLNIYGKGEMELQLRQLIKMLGLDSVVQLKGWTNNVVDELRNADMFLLSSRYEGMPNALMEAMAVGLPCISTDCDTGPSELITHGENGFLVSVGDIHEMAMRINEVIDMEKAKREQMGRSAHEFIKRNMNIDKVANMWQSLFEDLLS